jgi:hypothetical protein
MVIFINSIVLLGKYNSIVRFTNLFFINFLTTCVVDLQHQLKRYTGVCSHRSIISKKGNDLGIELVAHLGSMTFRLAISTSRFTSKKVKNILVGK